MIRTTDFVDQRRRTTATGCGRVNTSRRSRGRAKGRGSALPARRQPVLKEFADRTKAPMRRRARRARDDLPRVQARLKRSPAAEPGPKRRASARRRTPTPARSQLLPVQGNVYLLAGAGGNVAVQVGPIRAIARGLEVGARMADRILAEVKKLALVGQADPVPRSTPAPTPITSAATRRSPRRSARRRTGRSSTRLAGRRTRCRSSRTTTCCHGSARLPHRRAPTETFVGLEKEIYFNGEPVFDVSHPRGAHRRRQHRLLPQVRRGGHRRHLPDRQLPGDRPAARRVGAGRDRRPEPRARSWPCRRITRRAVRSSFRPRPHRRRVRRARVSATWSPSSATAFRP